MNIRRMATIYRQWMNGHSYIPPQDIEKYEKAYKSIRLW